MMIRNVYSDKVVSTSMPSFPVRDREYRIEDIEHKVCPECGCKNFTEDVERGEKVCDDCGLVEPMPSQDQKLTNSNKQGNNSDALIDIGKYTKNKNLAKLLRFEHLNKGRAYKKEKHPNETIERSEHIISIIFPLNIKIKERQDGENPNTVRQRENSMMKKFRNISTHDTARMQKGLFQGHSVNLNALVMAWFVHNFLRELNYSDSQLRSEIKKSMKHELLKDFFEERDRNEVDACFKKFLKASKKIKISKAKQIFTRSDITSAKLQAETDLLEMVRKLKSHELIEKEFEIPNIILKTLFDIENYPPPGMHRKILHSELIYRLHKRTSSSKTKITMKNITDILEVGNKGNHKKKITTYLNQKLGEE